MEDSMRLEQEVEAKNKMYSDPLLQENFIHLENQMKQELICLAFIYTEKFNLLGWVLGFLLVDVVSILFLFFRG